MVMTIPLDWSAADILGAIRHLEATGCKDAQRLACLREAWRIRSGEREPLPAAIGGEL
jgi:hypothetical protein